MSDWKHDDFNEAARNSEFGKTERLSQYELELKLEINRLKSINAELKSALEESLALNINWSETAEDEHLKHLSEYKMVIAQSKAAITKAKE